MANVRFYRLETLPSFEANHKGIFVHVTGTMFNRKWGISDGTGGYIEKDPATIYMTPEKVGGSVERINLVKWLSKRNITQIESGLWFGGVNGWELLSNDTNSIDATINAKIAALNAGGFTQATIDANTTEGSESATGSTLTIKGIKEFQGKIAQDNDNDVNIAIDGVYDETGNKIATQSTVITAINGLNTTETIQAVTKTTETNGNTTLTFNGVKEENGIISQGTSVGASTFIVGDAKLNIQIGSADAFEVFSANKQSDSTIKLDGLVFKKDGDVISVITPTAVSERNRLVTEKDVASINGAMHYRGAITSADSLNPDNWPETVAAGDVYIATGKFEKDGNIIESGDLIVFNSATLTDYTVVQSNITLGAGDGQVAANVGALADGKLVVGVNPATGSKGIKTVDFDVTNLTGTTGKNERTLKIENGTADTLVASLYHDVTITDDFTVIGKPFTKSINISSANRSIEIAANASENATGVVVDLVWNTIMEP